MSREATSTYGGAAEKVAISSSPLKALQPSLQGTLLKGRFQEGTSIQTEVGISWIVVPKAKYTPKPPYQIPVQKKHPGPALVFEVQDENGVWKKGEWK